MVVKQQLIIFGVIFNLKYLKYAKKILTVDFTDVELKFGVVAAEIDPPTYSESKKIVYECCVKFCH